MPFSLFHVDAFTATPFAGNPAVVVLMPKAGDAVWMQAFAAEMNLSETAFIWPMGKAFSLKWFTPAVEAQLCGHATLATAHILWETGILPVEAEAKFDTLSGTLSARCLPDEWIQLDFPLIRVQPWTATPELKRALGISHVAEAWHAKDRLIVRLESEEEVLALRPDQERLLSLDPAEGIIVTAAGNVSDFVSRYFNPAAGIPEDPVTGSSHCILGPLWGQRLGKTDLLARQLSRRGGEMRVRVRGDRVLLEGQAVTVTRGETIPPQ